MLVLNGSKLFDKVMVFLKEFFEKGNFEKKKIADDKRTCKIAEHAKTRLNACQQNMIGQHHSNDKLVEHWK